MPELRTRRHLSANSSPMRQHVQKSVFERIRLLFMFILWHELQRFRLHPDIYIRSVRLLQMHKKQCNVSDNQLPLSLR